MITRFFVITCFLLFCFGFVSLNGLAQQPLSASLPIAPPQTKPQTVIFKLKPDAVISSRIETKRKLQTVIEQIRPTKYFQKFPRAQKNPDIKPGRIDLTLFYEMEYPVTYSFAEIKQLLLNTQAIEYVEPLYIPAPMYLPSDPLADSLNSSYYHLKQIKAYKAWDIQKGGPDVVIGILDTGVRLTHNDLKDNIKYNEADPIDGIDNDQDGYTDNYYGWDVADNDNNPTADSNQGAHGDAVSGIAAASTDNGIGVAGVGFNCKFLPLKVFHSTIRGSFSGYEAIVYAADHGCQVINMSWGGTGYYSAFEQDIINYAALDKNVVIVAAAGNTAGDLDFYPASYENVISVTSVNASDIHPGNFSFSNKIDIAAAGVGVITTVGNNDNGYGHGGGTSMASPIVAGAAALLRKQFPKYTSRQIAEQLRITADNIYSLPENSSYFENIGYGRLNVYRALTETTTRAFRNINNQFNKNGLVYAGDTLLITSTFQNVLAPATNLQVTLTSSSPYVKIVAGNFNPGALGTSAMVTNTSAPFKIVLSPDTPLNEIINFRFGFQDGSYQDYQYFKVMVNPSYVTIDVNDLAASFTSKGTIGYDGLNFIRGKGVTYKNGDALLREGGLLVGISESRVSDNLSGEVIDNKNTIDADFIPLQPIRLELNPEYADMAAQGVITDAFPAAGMAGVRVTHRAYAWKDAPDNKYIILEYKLTNSTPETLTNLHAGIYSDWNISNANRNIADWDAANRMGYAYHAFEQNVYAGVTLLSNYPATHYAIDKGNTPSGKISVNNGFTTAEKYQAITNDPSTNTKAGLTSNGNDVADVVGAKLPDLPPGESIVVAFALLAGDNLPDLQASAAAAQAKYPLVQSSPAPMAQVDSICRGSSATIRPTGSNTFKFYADVNKQQLVGTGNSYTTPVLNAHTTYYVSTIDDFLYESKLVAVTVPVRNNYSADFTVANPAILSGAGKIKFTDASTHAVSWKWYIGNTLVSTLQHPEIPFKTVGTVQIRLEIRTRNGCSDAITKQIELVPPLPVIRSIAPICSGTTALLAPEGAIQFHFYADNQKQTLLATGSTFTTPKLTEATTYYISNADYNVESALVPVSILVNKLAADFSFSPDPVTPAANGKIAFTDLTPNAQKWTWNFGNGTSSTIQNPVITYQSVGIFPVKLTVQDNRGCNDSVTKNIEIKALAYKETWAASDFKLFPNPAVTNTITLNIPVDINTQNGINLEIHNVAGQLVKKQLTTENGNILIDLAGMKNGLYLLRIQGEDGLVVKRFQVMRR